MWVSSAAIAIGFFDHAIPIETHLSCPVAL
jgi:hypothetical protein